MLTDKAMLIRLSVSQWTGRKYDKSVSAHVAKQYQTDVSAGRYNKVLIAEEAIKTISKVVNEARAFHYANTLPWNDAGERILPSANYLPYTQQMSVYKGQFTKAVYDFIDAYPVLVDDAKARLNGMFNPADYPAVSEIDRRYGFDCIVNPLPSAEDFRVTLQQSEVDAIRQDIEQRTQDATERAMSDLWQRLHEAVSHMADKLSDKDAIFRDSLIVNAVELCELLPRLNITADANLERMRQEVESKLCSFKPQELRDNPTARKDAAKTAEEILAAMAGYTGV